MLITWCIIVLCHPGALRLFSHVLCSLFAAFRPCKNTLWMDFIHSAFLERILLALTQYGRLLYHMKRFEKCHCSYWYIKRHRLSIQILFDLCLYSSSLSLMSCTIVACFQPFPLLLGLEDFQPIVTLQGSTNYSTFMSLRSSFYFTAAMRNVLICTMFHMIISRENIWLHKGVQFILSWNVIFSRPFVLE